MHLRVENGPELDDDTLVIYNKLASYILGNSVGALL